MVVFRASGGPGIGNGHIMRCLSLAQGLHEHGWFSLLAAPEKMFSAVPQAHKFDRTLPLANSVDEVQKLSEAVTGEAELLVVDDYALDIQFEKPCRAWARKILVIDDLANRHHDADYIVDSAAKSASSYKSLVPRHCQCFIGPEWALLRPEFGVNRQAILRKRQDHATVKRILIGIGGADGRNLTPMLISATMSATAGQQVHIDVVLGGRARSLGTVQKMQQRKPTSFDLHIDTNKVAFLMSTADIAIGACGVGSWERCAMGLPTIGLITADNQNVLAAILTKAGAANVLGKWTKATEARVEAALASLLNNRITRQNMSLAASKLCDGRGTYRLSSVLNETQSKTGFT